MSVFKKILVISILFIAGCGTQTKEYEDFLHLRLAEDPTTLDPAYIVDVPGGAISAKLFNGLVRFDPEANIVPDLARKWEISEDGRTYRFHLREGVRFTNGREVEAEDFVYSLGRLIDSPRSWILDEVKGAAECRSRGADRIEGLRAAGRKVVEIELVRPFSLLLDYLAMPNGAVVPREEVEKWGKRFSDHPCGTGPFKLKEWKHDNRLILVRNPDYYQGQAFLKGIVYRVIPEGLTAVVEFEQGNLDILEVPRAEFKKFTTRQPWKDRIQSRVGLNIYYLGFNCQKPPFDDIRLRQAFNYAIDREKIIYSLLEGRAAAAAGPVPLSILDEEDENLGYKYNPEKAGRLLSECGIRLPLKVKFLFKADREVLSIAEVIQDYLKKVGVEVILVQREWSSFKEAVNQGDFDLFYLSWWGDYPSPENFLYPTFYSKNWGPAGNRSRFKDSRVDRMLEEARETTEIKKAKRLYQKVQERVVECAPWVFLWHKRDYVISRPRVENFYLPVIYNGDKFDKVKLIRD